jgi:CubicO group peptidase (beta-lactamase class C family)
VPAKKQPPPSFSATIKEGRKAVRAELKRTNSTSASIALVSNGKTVWSQTFGRVNTAGKKPSSTTRYGIGSVSKMVTAMAVMQLVDAGKISLDAPVVRYVPDFSMLSPQYKQITVRMLLNHSAGLPGIDLSNSLSPQWIPGYAEVAMAGLRNSRLKTTPGAMNVYCNDCFTLAGVLVERVSGVPFQDYVTNNILKPLGMSHSTYPTSVPAPGTVAPAIVDGKVQPWLNYNLFASGALLSTPRDMARMARVFTGDGVVDGKRILSSSAIQQMSVDQTTTTLRVGTPGEFRYGLGWDTVQDPALKAAGVLGWTKGGDAAPYRTTFAIAPDQGLAVVVQVVGVESTFQGARSLGQTVLLNALVETGAVKKMPKQVSGMPLKQKATPRDIKQISGTFLASAAPQLKVTEAKGRSLKLARLTGGKWVRDPGRYELRKDGAFWSTVTLGTSIRSVRAWGRTYLVQRSIDGTGTYSADLAIGQRTRPGGPLSPAWQDRVGQMWLLANEDPNSRLWLLAGLQFAAIPGLSGYLMAQGAPVNSVPFDATTSDNAGTMFLQIPFFLGRDLFDFNFSMQGGEELLSVSSSVLRPAATVPGLASGSNTVTIGAEGLVEWRKVPAASTVTISGQSDWKLYDADLSMLDSGGADTVTKQAPAGAYLAVFGPAGSTATVVVD